MSPLSQCLPTTRHSAGGASERAVGQHAGVVGVVERGADVVAHPAVDGDVVAHQRRARRAAGAQPHRLDRADLVERDRAGPGDRPAGLDREPRHGQAELGALGARRSSRSRAAMSPGLTGSSSDEVGDAEAAAEVELVEQLARWPRGPAPSRPTTRCAATSKPAVSKICEPMWLCSPVSSQAPARRITRTAAVERVAGGQREAELLVLVRGGDELVGVRLDADGRADQHRHRRAAGRHAAARQRHQPVDLVEGVDDDVPDPGVDGQLQLDQRLVVAVQRDPLGREAGGQREGELVAAAGVQVQAVVGDPAGDLAAEERLRRVVDVGAGEGVAKSAARPRKSASSSTNSGVPCVAGELGDRPAAQVQLAVDPLAPSAARRAGRARRGRPAARRRPVGVRQMLAVQRTRRVARRVATSAPGR